MRLLLITRNEIGGVLTYVLNFSKYLKSNNIDHLVILYEENSMFLDSEFKVDNILKFNFSKYSSQKSKFSIFKKHIFPTDILIVNDTTEIELINYYQIKNKSIYILHGDIIHYQGYLKKYHNGFDDIFCVSNYLKDKYKAKYPSHSFSVVHPMIEDYPIKNKYTTETPIKIASIGRFEYLKGSDTIKNTINNLKKKELSFDWTLFIPPFKNDEELLNEIGDLVIVKRGLNNKQVLEAIEKMDVLFFPSRSEGFSMSIVECLKRGVVVIARDIPMGIPEIINNYVNGIICKNDLEFKLAIQKFIENPELLLTMKKNAAEIANKKFSYELECNNLLNLILNSKSNGCKTYEDVELIDPKLPEFVLRMSRYIKHNMINKWI